MAVQFGLDILLTKKFEMLRGKSVGLVCNQASIASDYRHAVDCFQQAHSEGVIDLKCLIGPQHGLWGHTQDNMIEWEGYEDKRLSVPVYSLYGKHRKPTPEMLAGLDVLVVDLQDVGAKYYTFIWTLALCMEACEALGIAVVVLDRPNPINGTSVEGPAVNDGFRSFVGLYPMGIRHGLTVGEVALHLQKFYYSNCQLDVVKMINWQREFFYEDCEVPWAMPSPNIPTPDTAVVYPGMCLLEATNLSEGRGTTRPFELFGASWINAWEYADKLTAHDLPGVIFRPLEFEPTFHKDAKKVCGGCFMHVTDRKTFRPFEAGIAVILEAARTYPDGFAWKSPPYEYEYDKLPFDILVGNDWVRKMIEGGAPLKEISDKWQEESAQFERERTEFLIYE